MIKLTLTYYEAELLDKMIDAYLSKLAAEISVPEFGGFAEPLNQERLAAQKIRDDLENQGVTLLAETFGGYPE